MTASKSFTKGFASANCFLLISASFIWTYSLRIVSNDFTLGGVTIDANNFLASLQQGLQAQFLDC